MKSAIPLVAGTFLAMTGMSAGAAERIELVERALTDTIVDLGSKGDSVGDLLTFANPVFDAANQIKLGTDQGYCVRVVPGKSWECFWTLTLKDGQITVEGPFADSGDSLLAVTGGTGRFTGAKGVMRLHPRDAKGHAFDFVYELL